MSSSSSDSADSEDDDTHTLRCMQLQRQIQPKISLTSCLLRTYYSTYHEKNEPRTSPAGVLPSYPQKTRQAIASGQSTKRKGPGNAAA